ncbi:thioredoxin (plasmid) [Vibrio sp. qd031]|uniref:thioredoxin TrxC n=1 Tax=Vibrio sp. qd031 TaxID=1603038 RepID=UPI000A0FEFF2|nr:thioredoxin TrxC [Vibrio sp. qd031]ORT52553.1 thioredoxin [Vibrio sp. qd031]
MESLISRCTHCKTNNRLPIERLKEQPNCGKCAKPLLDGSPIEGTVQNFSALIQGQTPTVVDFWAPWCNPCVGFAPVFEDTAKQYSGKARFIKLDTEAQTQIAAQYQIRSIPTIMVFKGGKVVATINGALPKSQFTAWLDQQL